MKLLNSAVLFFLAVLLLGCNKAYNPPSQTQGSGASTHADSLSIITSQKWVLYQDSISNVSFNFSDGEYPVPGVLYGFPTDYWQFSSNGTLVAIANGANLPETSYQFLANGKLYVPSSPDALTFTIATLNSTTFILIDTDTSSTGGTYYQRLWLKR